MLTNVTKYLEVFCRDNNYMLLFENNCGFVSHP